jgi:hypothetical protein
MLNNTNNSGRAITAIWSSLWVVCFASFSTSLTSSLEVVVWLLPVVSGLIFEF